MPIFEFRCRACGAKTTALVLSRARVSEVRCHRCDGADLEKLYSRFATPKSEEARLDAMADPASLSGLDDNDPQSVARWMKRMGREMGEDVGEDLEQAIEEEMAGGADGAEDSGADSDEL